MTASRRRLARSIVHGVLLVGAGTSILCMWEALRHFEDNAGWDRAFLVSGGVTLAGAAAWVALALDGAKAGVAALWRASRVAAVITIGLVIASGILLNLFTRSRFDGEPVERWLFFSLGWALACYLLVRISGSITRAAAVTAQADEPQAAAKK